MGKLPLPKKNPGEKQGKVTAAQYVNWDWAKRHTTRVEE
jgi:hypothetical protein